MLQTSRFQRTFRRWVYVFIGITAFLSLIFSIATGLLLGYLKTLPPIEQLENYAPPQATSIYDRTGLVKIATFARQNRVVVPLDKMPPNLKTAFVAVEDKRFYRHLGIDFLRTGKALLINLWRRRRAQGASTISQQLPRNLLKGVSHKKLIRRKIKETLLALQIEGHYSKSQILEFYLNQIYLGNGAYGVQAAARTFFNKDVSELTLPECAVLSGIPQRPARFSPINNIEASTRRRNIVLRLMYKQGFISKSQYNDAVSTPIKVSTPPPATNRAPYFVEYTRRSLIKTGKLDNEKLYSDGYIIHTTLDSELQEIADEELKKGLRAAELTRQRNALKYQLPLERRKYGDRSPVVGKKRLALIMRVFSDSLNVKLAGYSGILSLPKPLPYYQPEEILKPGKWINIIPTDVHKPTKTFFAELADKKPLQGAVVILDAHTAEIRAMCGGENFYDFNNNGQWNRAAQGPGRQPGSAIKPLFYTCALDSGYTFASMFNDRKIVFADGYSPKNYENRHFGLTTLEEALEHSRNVITVLLFQALKARRALPFVRRFDVTDKKPSWRLTPDPTVALGSLSVTPLSLTAAYVPFVNYGVGIRPRAVTKVIGPDKKSALRIKPYEREIVSPQTACLITYALMGAIRRGTGKVPIADVLKGEDLPEMAGKTGTTTGCVDAWFIGYTPDLVIGAWVGFDDNRLLGIKMSGARVAAPIWREIVRRSAHLNRRWHKHFHVPDDLVFCDVCSKSGLLATNACKREPDAVIYEKMPFKRGTQPRTPCAYH